MVFESNSEKRERQTNSGLRTENLDLMHLSAQTAK
jgi:hypothetical protein